jgi:hypothetical protein
MQMHAAGRLSCLVIMLFKLEFEGLKRFKVHIVNEPTLDQFLVSGEYLYYYISTIE